MSELQEAQGLSSEADFAIFPLLPSASKLAPLSFSGLICQMDRNTGPSMSKSWEN